MRLKVYARGSILVPRFDIPNASPRRFVGRVFDSTLGPAGGWPPSLEPEEVPDLYEFKVAIQEGSLWPADAETARHCDVPFDPNFGGELNAARSALKALSSPIQPQKQEG